MSLVINKNIKKSYKECIKILKKNAKSYFYGSLLFSKSKFYLISSFYAFVRVVDDIVDELNYEFSSKDKYKRLTDFKNMFYTTYEDIIIKRKYSLIYNEFYWTEKPFFLLALMNTVIEIDLEKSVFDRFFKSMFMDLKKHKYRNYEELEEYMDGSAGLIGEVMVKIMAFRKKDKTFYEEIETIEKARLLGHAFQLTNFIRDIREDYLMKPNRIYIPQDSLEEHNVNLKNYICNDKFDVLNLDDNILNLVHTQITRNRFIYYRVGAIIDRMNDEDRNAIGLAYLLYSSILDEIEFQNYNVFMGRISLSFYKKIKLCYEFLGFWNFIWMFINYINYIYF